MSNIKLPALTIEPRWKDVIFSMKGLSLKAVRNTNHFGHALCRLEGSGQFYINIEFKTNPRTARITKEALISYLKELYGALSFGKIKIIGHYELTGEQLMEEILKPNK